MPLCTAHDEKYRIMFAKNGCLACEAESLANERDALRAAVAELVAGLRPILGYTKCHRTRFPFNEEPCGRCDICVITKSVAKYGGKEVG